MKHFLQKYAFRNLVLSFGLGLGLVQDSAVAQVSGTVFKDFNANGMKDNIATYNEVGMSGVVVKAYDISGAEVGTAITDANGVYTIAAVSGNLRIEFSALPAASYTGPQGTGSGTSVQFVTGPATGINFGVNEPGCYWDSGTDPKYAMPCYVNGTAVAGGTDAAIVATPFSSTGLNAFYQNNNGVQGTGPVPTMIATAAQVGTVWGEAWQKNKKQLFFTAFLKRHCGFADGPGYIYVFDYSTAVPSLVKKINLEGVVPANGGAALAFGSVTRNATVGNDNYLATDKADPSRDMDAFGKVGTISYGDAEMQPGTDFLWTVNLFQQALVKIDVSGAPASLPGAVNQYILSSLQGYPTSTTGILRPFGISFHGGKGFLGVVADASITKVAADLKAYVLSFDPNDIAAGFSTELNFNPSIKRSSADQYDKFHYWQSAWTAALISSDGRCATPVISNFDFDANDNMYVGIMDRFGHQIGAWNYKALSGNTQTNMQGIVSGDLLKACKTASGWSIEGTGTCLPSGGTEFFNDIAGDGNEESFEGGTAILKGKNQILAISLDPHPQGSTGDTYWDTQGAQTYNLTTGNIDNWYSVAYSGSYPAFGKASGLGDIELLVGEAPLEIGNRIWDDADSDGIQDADEVGISNVVVKLFKSGTQVGQTTSAIDGSWYFNNSNVTMNGAAGLLPNMAYIVRVEAASFPSGKTLTTQNATPPAGQTDVSDSDASIVGSDAEIAYTTGMVGQNDHTLDMGFKTAATCTQPSAITLTQTAPTCVSGVAQNDGKITLTAISNADKFGVSTGATYSGTPDYAAATAIGTLPQDLQTAIPNSGGTYTIRFFNGVDDCYKDSTVTVNSVCCLAVTSTTPVCHANGTPEAPADDYFTFSINVVNSLPGAQTFSVTAVQNGNPVAVSLSNGMPATAVNCGLNTPLRTPDGSAGNGDLTLTITDNIFGCSTTLVVNDPGECGLTCTPGSSQMVMYNYSTQFDITELDYLPIVLPKFDDQGGTRTLISAKLDYEIGMKTIMIHENRAANAQNFRVNFLGDAFVDLNGNTIATASLAIPGTQTSIAAGVLVPAQGTWPGDSTPPLPQPQVASTLLAMFPWMTDEKMIFFKDPRTDPRWVTNATGNPAHDDDIVYYPPAIDTALGSITFTAPADLALFIGTGSLPLTASTLTGLQTIGGGGNIATVQKTRAYASAKVTYTFECLVSCTQPVAITLSQSAPTCVSGVAQNNGKITLTSVTNADKFGVSTGATYSGTPDYAAATAIGALPQDLFSAVPNTGGTFTIRLFNGANDCFKDTTLTILAITCGCLSLDPWMTAQGLGGTGGPTASVASGPGTLGGERDMVLSNLTPADGNGIFADAVPTYFAGFPVLEIANASGRFSKLTITYDGPDGDAIELDTTGLNGVDLLTNGANGFISTITTDGAPGTGDLPVMFQVFDMNGGASSALINVAPTNNATVAFSAPFSAFTAIGGFTAADFTQVGSIVLMIDMQNRNGWDVLMTDMKLDCCINPSGITLSKTAPTCVSGVAQNDGKITLTAVADADKIGISTGATYSGTPDYAAATAIGTLPQDLQTAIPNTGGTYTIRFFNGADDCFKDSTVTVNSVSCFVQPTLACGMLIDSFNLEQGSAPYNSLLPLSSTLSGQSILLGGERDLLVDNLSGSAPIGNSFYVGYDALDLTNGVGEYSFVTVQWDGQDGNANTLDPTGLGGLDFATLNIDKITTSVTADFPVTPDSLAMSLELWSNAGSASVISKKFHYPNDGNYHPIEFLFSEKTNLVGSGVDLSDIGAVVLKIDMTNRNGWDVNLNFLRLECCEQPSAITLSQTAPTCVSGVAQNDGKITLTAVTNADKFGISTGAAYSGTPDYTAATAIGTLPQDLQTSIPNTGGTYTIRFFNGADDCFKDSTVTVAAVNCVAPCALTITSVSPSACNPATNQFSLDVVVTYSNPPTGDLTVSTSGGATSTVAQTGSPQTITFTGLNSDGVQDYAVVAEFVNDANCKHVLPAAYDAPANCLCDTTMTVRDTTICAGSNVNLYTQLNGSKGILYYSSDGLVFNPLTDPTLVSPLATTTYFVKDSLSASCVDIDPLKITVEQPANAGIANSPLAPICMAATGLATIDLFAQLTGEDSGGIWAKTSGPAVGINFDGNAGTLDPNGLTAGTYVFEYTVNGILPCPSDSEQFTIVIQDCTLPCPPKVCLPVSVEKVVGGN